MWATGAKAGAVALAEAGAAAGAAAVAEAGPATGVVLVAEAGAVAGAVLVAEAGAVAGAVAVTGAGATIGVAAATGVDAATEVDVAAGAGAGKTVDSRPRKSGAAAIGAGLAEVTAWEGAASGLLSASAAGTGMNSPPLAFAGVMLAVMLEMLLLSATGTAWAGTPRGG